MLGKEHFLEHKLKRGGKEPARPKTCSLKEEVVKGKVVELEELRQNRSTQRGAKAKGEMGYVAFQQPVMNLRSFLGR